MHTTRFCQPLPGIIKNKRLDNQISKKTKEPKQDQIWLTSYECSEQRDFGMVLSPILGGCQLVLLLFEQFCVLFILFFIFLCIYYSVFSSITLYSQVPDVSNCTTFLLKFKITLNSFLLLI